MAKWQEHYVEMGGFCGCTLATKQFFGDIVSLLFLSILSILGFNYLCFCGSFWGRDEVLFFSLLQLGVLWLWSTVLWGLRD
jgi:hypothetical protein